MGQRQNEILVKGIEHAECQLIMVEFAVYGLVAHILQRVVHPAHVPLESEAKTTDIGRA